LESEPIVIDLESCGVTKSDYVDWLSHPVTKAVKRVLEDVKRDREIQLGRGYTLSDDATLTAQKTAKMVGCLEGLALFLEMEIEDDEEIDEENETE
jgi:hypothetical protein